MGRNGAGKSTTLKALIGMLGRRRGQITFMGHDLSHSEPHHAGRLGLGFVPEDRRVFTDLTVMENLEVGRQRIRQWPDGTTAPHWTPERLFTLFPNLGEMPQRHGGSMTASWWGTQASVTVESTSATLRLEIPIWNWARSFKIPQSPAEGLSFPLKNFWQISTKKQNSSPSYF